MNSCLLVGLVAVSATICRGTVPRLNGAFCKVQPSGPASSIAGILFCRPTPTRR